MLIELIREQPVKGAAVIGLSEHVDYWDRLGWKDPFRTGSSPSASRHTRGWRAANDIYTPQIIVDGVDLVIGHDRPAVLDAIRRAAGREKRPVTLEWSADVSRLSVAVDRSPRTANATVFLAVTEDGLRTSVKRGENSGRMLDHAAVARRLIQIGKTDKDGGFEGRGARADRASVESSERPRRRVRAERQVGTHRGGVHDRSVASDGQLPQALPPLKPALIQLRPPVLHQDLPSV